jgi:hypothetical protein
MVLFKMVFCLSWWNWNSSGNWNEWSESEESVERNAEKTQNTIELN